MTRLGTAVLVIAAAATTVVSCHRDRVIGIAEEQTGPEVTVDVGSISRATLRRLVTAYGRVEPEPANAGKPPAKAVVGSPVSGILAHIDCVEGQRVSAGATLFRLDDRAAQVARRKAAQTLASTERTVVRQHELLAAGGTSERAVQEAELERDTARSELAAADTQLALLRVTSPLSGVVVRIGARLGQAVDVSSMLAEVVDLERLVVSAGVASQEAPLVQVGQRVELDGADLGSVVFVGRDIDAASDTARVRVAIAAGEALRPGQFVQIRIVVDEHRDCLAVPLESLVTRAGEGSWIVVADGDRALRTPVIAGLREGELVEVEGDGLREGMSIVTADAYSLPEDARIRIPGR